MASKVVPTSSLRTRWHNRKAIRHAGRGARELVLTLENRLLLSTTWYVATTGGLNSNPGTLAKPFQTIQAAANVAEPGDTVLIEAGVYHESVVPAHSGTLGNPITYEPYNGQYVEIDGADTLTGWTQYSGNIYEAPQNWNLGDGNNQLFEGGQMLTEARWPNTSLDPLLINTAKVGSSNAVDVTQDTPNSCTIYSSSLTQPAGYWVGATMHISPGQQWVWQTGTVTASAPGSITYSYTQLTKYEVPTTGNPFYLTGIFSALDAPGEWYHSAATNTTYVWLPDSSVPNTNVEAKHRQYAFDLSGLSWINLQGINIKACTINTSTTSSHIEMSLIGAAFLSNVMDDPYPWNAKSQPHTTGIIINGTYITLTQSYIAYSSGDCVFLGGSHNSVINNTIIDADYAVGEDAGVSIQGSNNLVAHNNINNTGRSGITFYFTTDIQVLNNLLYNIGQRATDCGGIYTYGTNAAGSRVAYNQIFNLHSGGYGNGGIFLDNNTQNLEVDHNLVYNDDICVKMNGASVNDDFYDNDFIGTLFLNAIVQPTLAIGEGSTPTTTNCLFENNIFVGGTTFLSGMVQNHNLFYTTVAAASPNFVNMAANNYQLAAGSPAIAAGVVVAPYTNGYTGTAPDIGAFAYNGPTYYSGGAPATRSLAGQTPSQTFDATQGTNLTPPGVGSCDNYDWLEYSAVNLGLTDTTFSANLAVPAAYAGGTIEVHLDSPTGTLVGSLKVTSTGAFTTYATESTSVTNAAIGVHDVYLVFRGGYGICNLNWFSIS